MSTSPIGFTTMPKLLPVTGSFALPFTAYFTLLSLRVVRQRLSSKKYLGDSSGAAGAAADPSSDALYVACRAHSNYVEGVPLALLLAALAELNGANRRALTAALSALFVFRVLHSEAGMFLKGAMGGGRPLGYFGGLGVTAGLAGYAAYLVKGYWGF
ncbi:uncharacterized protein E0L32_000847 [Thyridium curvatum]|uniref:Uncharacterized protein n=1 Tax=Thyridium curvatum TaxID=1093900 RepID=A0A507B7Q2_9PEZI|nr:uncharacterized protein E0L32_000847 [Thyridium curvatum]TPX12670.1 hypothetical protein E0L32_000847 [Thyridium curvatum]